MAYTCTGHELPVGNALNRETRDRTMKRYRAGSDASTAGGRISELSEWQRSTSNEGISMPRRMSGTATGKGSNDNHKSMHELPVGASPQMESPGIVQ